MKIDKIVFRDRDNVVLVVFEGQVGRTHVINIDDINSKAEFRAELRKRVSPINVVKDKFISLGLSDLVGEDVVNA